MAGIRRQCWRQTFMLLVVLFTALRDDTATATRAGVPGRLRRVQKTGYALIKGHENAMIGNANRPSKSNSFQHTRRPDPSIRQNTLEAILDDTNDRIARPLAIAVADNDSSNATIANDEQSQIETLRQNDPAFDKCYGILEDVSEDQVRVTPEEYVAFLNQLTNGEISPTADLNAIDKKYATTWYASTCPNGRPCAQESAYISLDPDEEDALNGLISMCATVMSLSMTTATVTFEFTIRYNSDLISMEAVGDCLEIAAENLILDSFGCDFEGNANATRDSDGINNNAPIRKLQSSAVSFESSSSAAAAAAAQPSTNSGRRDTTVDRRNPVDYWEDEDEKIIIAMLMNEGQDSRFLDMIHMSMQPTPPTATTFQPTLPPRPPTLPPSTPPRSSPPTLAPRSPPPTLAPTVAPPPTLAPRSPPPTLAPTVPAPPPTLAPTVPAPPPTLAPTVPPTLRPTPFPSSAPVLTFPPSACPYNVEGTVDSIVEFPCEGLQQDITCGIVRMTITVTAPQSIMPSEDELRAQVIATLREAINGDGFEAFFPPGCSVTG